MRLSLTILLSMKDPVRRTPTMSITFLLLSLDLIQLKIHPKMDLQLEVYQGNIKFLGLKESCYFKIYYLFKTEALMITVYKFTKIRHTVLQEGQSLLMMHNTILLCTVKLEFLVDFPDIRNCAQSQKTYYQIYAAQFGFNNPLYLPTFRGDPFSVKKYQTMGRLGEGSFGTVYKGVHMQSQATSKKLRCFKPLNM